MIVYIIYQHRNQVNHKSYVGRVISHTGIQLRWVRHIRDAMNGSNGIFHRAIVAYGVDVWDHIELQRVETLEKAIEAEKFWIAQLCCNALRENHDGYNMTDGGGGVEGYRHSFERRNKISCATKGKKRSLETKQRMRKPKSEEHKTKLRAHLERIRFLPRKLPQIDAQALMSKIEKLRKTAQLPHVKEAKRQAQLRRWAKWREEKLRDR